MRTYRPRRKDGTPYRLWYCEFRCHVGKVRRFPALTDRAASAELGRVAEKLAELRSSRLDPREDLQRAIVAMPARVRALLLRWDILDAARAAEREGASRPLVEMLARWGESIRAGGSTEKHATLVVSRARTLFLACGFRFWPDIRPAPVEEHLRDLRESDGRAIARHLAAMGDDVPANVRAYWTTTIAGEGLSSKTSNHHLASARAFCSWMVRRGHAVADPLRVITPLNARTDRRVRRRALTEDELRKLISATQNGPTLGLVPGPTRALAYALMAETGFRVAELVALRVSSFTDLDGASPTVSLPAHATKNRRDADLPLRRSTAAALSRFLAGRGALDSALGLPLAWRPPRALRVDLASAGLPFVDESGRRFDAHSLRGMLATRLLASGASVPAAQKLMRHSTSDMTVSTYARVRGDREEREALERMPDILPTNPDAIRATGTADARGGREASHGAFPLPTGDTTWPRLATPSPEEWAVSAIGGLVAPSGVVRVVEAAGIEPASREPRSGGVYVRVLCLVLVPEPLAGRPLGSKLR